MQAQTQVHWKKLCFKLTGWLIAEIILSFLNVDTLADYGEFILGRHSLTAIANYPTITLITPPTSPSSIS